MTELPNLNYLLAGIVKYSLVEDLEFLNPQAEILLLNEESYINGGPTYADIGFIYPVKKDQFFSEIEEVEANLEESNKAFFSRTTDELVEADHVFFISKGLELSDCSDSDLSEMLRMLFSSKVDFEHTASNVFKSAVKKYIGDVSDSSFNEKNQPDIAEDIIDNNANDTIEFKPFSFFKINSKEK